MIFELIMLIERGRAFSLSELYIFLEKLLKSLFDVNVHKFFGNWARNDHQMTILESIQHPQWQTSNKSVSSIYVYACACAMAMKTKTNGYITKLILEKQSTVQLALAHTILEPYSSKPTHLFSYFPFSQF